MEDFSYLNLCVCSLAAHPCRQAALSAGSVGIDDYHACPLRLIEGRGLLGVIDSVLFSTDNDHSVWFLVLEY